MQHKVWKHLALLILIGSLVYGSVSTLRYWGAVSLYAGEIDFAEGVILIEATRLIREGTIYPATAEQRFIGSIYGPLFYTILAAVQRGSPESFQPMRWTSLFASLMTLLLIAVIIHG